MMTALRKALRYFEKEKKADFLPALEGLRFIAIGWVLLFHLAFLRSPDAEPVFRLIAAPGHLGVELFFCISGFVMALPAAKKLSNGDLRYYFVRRLTRLEVPYLVALSLGLIAKVSLSGLAIGEALQHYLASATYLHNIIYQARSTISVVTWSLEVEFQFYLLAPLLWRGLIFQKGSIVRLLSLIVLFAVLAGSLKTGQQTVYFLLLPGYLHFFLSGALFAVLHVRHPQVSQNLHGLCNVGLPLGIALLFLTQFVPDAIQPSLSLLGCIALMSAALYGPLAKRALSNYFVVTVGGMCYSIYLYHSFVYNALDRVWAKFGIAETMMTTVFRTAFYITIAVSVSAILFAVIERPFMKSELSRKIFSWLGFERHKAAS